MQATHVATAAGVDATHPHRVLLGVMSNPSSDRLRVQLRRYRLTGGASGKAPERYCARFIGRGVPGLTGGQVSLRLRANVGVRCDQ